MTTTLGTLVNAEPTFQRLATVRLPVKTAYQVSKWVRVLATETAHFHRERDRTIREMGAPTGNGEEVTVTPHNMPAFIAQMTELSVLPVEVPLPLFDLSTLGDTDISAVEVLTLLPLLTDQE